MLYPLCGLRSTGGGAAAEGQEVLEGLVRVVEAEEFVGQVVVEAAQRGPAQAQGRRREQQGLGQVAGLQEGQAQCAQSVAAAQQAEVGVEGEEYRCLRDADPVRVGRRAREVGGQGGDVLLRCHRADAAQGPALGDAVVGAGREPGHVEDEEADACGVQGACAGVGAVGQGTGRAVGEVLLAAAAVGQGVPQQGAERAGVEGAGEGAAE